MRFLLDTNIISAYLKGNRVVFDHFVQHSGGLATSAICVGELYSWTLRHKTKPAYAQGLSDALSEMPVLPVDHDVARRICSLGLV